MGRQIGGGMKHGKRDRNLLRMDIVTHGTMSLCVVALFLSEYVFKMAMCPTEGCPSATISSPFTTSGEPSFRGEDVRIKSSTTVLDIESHAENRSSDTNRFAIHRGTDAIVQQRTEKERDTSTDGDRHETKVQSPESEANEIGNSEASDKIQLNTTEVTTEKNDRAVADVDSSSRGVPAPLRQDESIGVVSVSLNGDRNAPAGGEEVSDGTDDSELAGLGSPPVEWNVSRDKAELSTEGTLDSTSNGSNGSISTNSSSTSLQKTLMDSNGTTEFHGLDLGIVNGVDLTRLSYMIFRIIKTYNITSMVDVSCETTYSWMPQLVQRLEFEVLGFTYTCVLSDQYQHATVARHFNATDVSFLVKIPWSGRLPQADLFFSWDFLKNLPMNNVWRLFKNVKSVGIPYLLFGNNSMSNNRLGRNSGKRGVLNVRRGPFFFEPPQRVISNITDEDATFCQLMFYQSDRLRRNF